LTLAACEPTGHDRCDRLLIAQHVEIEAHGWRLRCDPADAPHLGWADRSTRTVWLWPDRMPDDRVLRRVAWHELGHIVAWERGVDGTGQQAEEWADAYSWCREPLPVSYYGDPRGVDCSTYR